LQASERDAAELADRLMSAVREAGAMAKSYLAAGLKHWTKGKDSPVSEADLAADALLKEQLSVPGIGWLSEETEDNPTRLGMRRVWVVDPIDGTRAFIAGLPDWSISAALVEDGRPVMGAIYAPVDDEMFFAIAGAGATCNGKAMTATSGSTLTGAKVSGPKRTVDLLQSSEPGIVAVPRVHSLALRFARIAQGRLDAAFAGGNSRDWDLAAADVIVHEAQGLLTTLAGEPVIYNRPVPIHSALVAAGRSRHPVLSDILRARMT
jgi:myo-inositol-1(or 4)-monophosphatase